MKVNDIVRRVDETRPNDFDELTKIAWVVLLERKIASLYSKFSDLRDVAFPALSGETGEEELAAPAEFEDVYVYWLLFKMDFAQGDNLRASDDAALFNSDWQDLSNWCVREHTPRGTHSLKI